MRRTLGGMVDTCRAVVSAPLTPSVLRALPRLGPAWDKLGSQIRPVIDISTFAWQWRMEEARGLDQPSPYEADRILQPGDRGPFLDKVAADMLHEFPIAGHVVERWSGALTSTIGNMPVISDVEGIPGMYVGSGFNYGLTMPPAAGEALADLVEGRPTRFDLGPYRLSRFTDGSPLVCRA